MNLKNNTSLYIPSAYLESNWQVKKLSFQKLKGSLSCGEQRKVWNILSGKIQVLFREVKTTEHTTLRPSLQPWLHTVFFCVFLLLYFLKHSK